MLAFPNESSSARLRKMNETDGARRGNKYSQQPVVDNDAADEVHPGVDSADEVDSRNKKPRNMSHRESMHSRQLDQKNLSD